MKVKEVESTVLIEDNDLPLKKRLDDWLQSVGLRFNPFVPLDAGIDARLSTYLVGHDAFTTLWGDWPAVLYAPAGGGKSAFRVRLAYACRAGEDGRRLFPIVYHLPAGPLSIDEHLRAIGRAAAQELLLELVWRPEQFENLALKDQKEIRWLLDWNAPGLLSYFLPQLLYTGSPDPVVSSYDPSASHLPNRPAPERIRALCHSLQALPAAVDPPPPVQQRFERMVAAVFKLLQRDAVYLLVDSVDAHPETINAPQVALQWLRPLLSASEPWEQKGIYLKLFLPDELTAVAKEIGNFLTPHLKLNTIKWTPDRLVEMLQSRVRAASDGKFDSLDAVSGPALHHVEQNLVQEMETKNPRALLRVAGNVLWAHARPQQPSSLLGPADLDLAIKFYAGRDMGE